MDHQRLRYNFFFNKTRRLVEVLPEGKTGHPNSFAFGDFKLEPGEATPYSEHRADLLAELEAAMNTLKDVNLEELEVRILSWEDEWETIEAQTQVAQDPPVGEPVPVSSEIRADAKGLNDPETPADPEDPEDPA